MKYKLLLITLILVSTASALDICPDTIDINTNCTMVTPYLICNNYTYDLFDSNNISIIINQPLTEFRNGTYQFNFNYPEGEYIIRLCDETYRTVHVSNATINSIYNMIYKGDNTFYMYVVAIIVAVGLLLCGFYLDDDWFKIIGGMLFIIMGVNLQINGFPYLNSNFLKEGIVIILIGIGFFYIIAPSLRIMEENDINLGGI